MANIQPFDYQKSTNIEEHNQIVNKVNEIVEVINNVNLDTINSEIADLKSKATATDTEIANIKDKDTTQDTEINGITKSLVSNVTATFDNPSRELKISLGREASPSIDATVVIPASSETGQYSAGNGITIENYQIAVDTGVVALKTDIPVVPDVSEITNRLDTIDGEITGINTDITNITNKNTEQDTAINGKVAIAQGTENAGKILGIGSDGNVTPIDAGGSSGGGEVWEEIDLSNIPTDWVKNDRIKVAFCITANWAVKKYPTSHVIELIIPSVSVTAPNELGTVIVRGNLSIDNWIWLFSVNSAVGFNDTSDGGYMLTLQKGSSGENNKVTRSNITSYIYKMWRCRASA